MTYSVIFDLAAETDLTEIYDYLLPRAGERDATTYIDAIVDYCISLGTFPERGVLSKRSLGLRTVGFRRRATIAFRIKGGTVTIMRVFNGGRDVTLPADDEGI